MQQAIKSEKHTFSDFLYPLSIFELKTSLRGTKQKSGALKRRN